MADQEVMGKEDVVNGLKYMAAYIFLSLLHIEQHGLKDSTPETRQQYITAEESRLRVLTGAIFHLSGEHFNTDELRAANAARRAGT